MTVSVPDHRSWTDAQASATVNVDGHAVELAYYDDGEGAPVVFLHGIPTWGYLWRRVAPPLADRFRVIVPDLAGYGNSAKWDGFDRSIRVQETAIGDLLDALDVGTVTLVAHDIGGGVALRLASHEPDRVDRLVCTNTVCYDSWPVEFIATLGLPETAEMSDAELDEILESAFVDGAYGEADPAFVTGMKVPWQRDGGKLALARAAVATNTNHTTELDYGAIDAEFLALWGEDDVMQPLEYGERLAVELGGRVETLSDAYHWVPEDRGTAYSNRLRAFLTENDS